MRSAIRLWSWSLGFALFLMSGCQASRSGDRLQPLPDEGQTKGWTSGGSIVAGDSSNPWFLKNTAVVHYCIQSDPAVFPHSPSELRALIGKALAYWRDEFTSHSGPPGAIDLGIASQAFLWDADCGAGTDLTFQFGVLSKQQRHYLGDPTQYLGVAVRTEYDSSRMKGKGFIYISPDEGSGRYRGDYPIRSAWRQGDGGFLHKVLVHELGHVFGIPHLGRGVSDVMSADFSDQLLRHSQWAKLALVETIPHFFRFREGWYLSCREGWHGRVAAFFGVAEESCLVLELNPHTMDPIVAVDAIVPGQHHSTKLGQIRIRHRWRDDREAIQVWIPTGQQVFSLPANAFLPAGFPIVTFGMTGNFYPEPGTGVGHHLFRTTLLLSMSPGQFSLQSVGAGFSESPFRLDAMFPFTVRVFSDSTYEDSPQSHRFEVPCT